MDGRWIRKWLLASCLLPGSLGCSLFQRSEPQSPWGSADGGLMPNVSTKKSFFDRSNSDIPTEVVEAPRKGPPLPGTMLAVADAQLEHALDEKTPQTNRQELLDRARQGYQKVLQQHPDNGAAMLGLARYYTRVGERERAVEMYKKYLTQHPDDKAVPHQVALAHAQWKDWLGAVAWCEFTLKLDPESLSTRKTMAFCYARAGMTDKALEVMMQVMPAAQAHYQIARVLEHQSDFAGSKAQIQMALRADPNFNDAREFLAELDTITSPTAPDQNSLRGGVQQAGYTDLPQPPPEAMKPMIQYSPPQFRPLNQPQQPPQPQP